MQRLSRTLVLAVRAAQCTAIAVSLYHTAISTFGHRRYVKLRDNPPEPPVGLPRFALIVCARNEEDVIARTVADLLDMDYPAELRDVVVVAHNCTDDTARLAARAGARVVERFTDQPGKAHAIEAGLAALDPAYDYVGVFDADARVTPDFLTVIAAHSAGQDCMQAETVPIADHDWFAEGYGFGRKARNIFWWRPREALGLSTTITGSGWFIRPEILHRYNTGSWTMTEDLELSARLVADGHRVSHISRAQIACGEPRNLKDSFQQRSRWVRGHIGVIRGRWLPLVFAGARGNRQALDLALYLVVPTRTLTRLGVTGAAVLGLIWPALRLPSLLIWTALAGEWFVPALIGWRERLFRLSSGSLNLAARHTLLGLLWFPIGFWAMGTARLRAWHAMPRALESEANRVA
jgi:cellulose synthase/poly-beta-1,6-N-acetylglucosamine synthase-like glycosyltransferase